MLKFWCHVQESDGKLVALQSVNNQTCGYDLYDQNLFHLGRPLHVCVQESGFARQSSNRKCFLLAISDLKMHMAEVQEDDSSKQKHLTSI